MEWWVAVWLAFVCLFFFLAFVRWENQQAAARAALIVRAEEKLARDQEDLLLVEVPAGESPQKILHEDSLRQVATEYLMRQFNFHGKVPVARTVEKIQTAALGDVYRVGFEVPNVQGEVADVFVDGYDEKRIIECSLHNRPGYQFDVHRSGNVQ